MHYPITIQNLIECLRKIPGIGEKTAERYAMAILDLDQSVIDLFSKSILDTKLKIKHCLRCNNLTENDLCDICKNEQRNKDLLCVVEDPKNILLFERLGTFDGYYHVLNGLISPLDGINPEDIGLDKLIERIKNKENQRD